MTWFRNMRIRSKLLLVFGILTVMVLVLTIVSVATTDRIEKSYINLQEGPQKRASYSSDAVRELMIMRRYLLSMVFLSEDYDELENYYARYSGSAEQFIEYIDSYYLNLENDVFLSEDEKEWRKEAVNEIKGLFLVEFQEYSASVYDSALVGDMKRVNSLFSTGIILGDEITEKIESLRRVVQESADEISTETSGYSHRSRMWVIIISVLIMVISLAVSIFMSHYINAPVVSIGNAVAEIAKGNLSYPIRSVYRDEIGMLSNHIGDMVDTISMLNRSVSIVDNLDDLVFVTDFEYNLVYRNRRVSEIFGEDNEPAPMQKCHKLLNGTDKPCDCCPLPGLASEKDALPSIEWVREITVNDKAVWYVCKSSIIRWVDGSLVQICACKDDSIRREKEEQQLRYEHERASVLEEAARREREANHYKSIFLANMSHEIRTPMNGIIGFSELAMDDEIPQRTRDYLGKINTSAASLMQIINDILDISKIEAGKIEIELTPFDLSEVFRLCRTIITPKALEKGITLFCYAEPSVGRMLIGDPTRLRQSLLNLLSNSVKFTITGMVKLLSAIVDTAEDSVTVHFEVKDSGIGMSPEQVDRIFEPFVQADNSVTRKYGGTGLGLAITKSIVELMGGELRVESAVGLGSKFSFDLTFETVNVTVEELHKTTTGEVIEKPFFEGEVLVCEDNELNQQVIQDHLSRVGLQTVIAANGRIGVDYVRQRMDRKEKPFDLIFMDIHMPVMDGLDAAKKLSEIGSKTPIVALTANIMSNDIENYHEAGMCGCVPKPFSTSDLWSCLLEHLTPVGVAEINEEEQKSEDEKQRLMMITSFVKNNGTTYKDITESVQSGDIKKAHRLAHTLKGVAGAIGLTMLQRTAQAVEQSLTGGKAELNEEQMNSLEYELNMALAELTPIASKRETPAGGADTEQAIALLNKLGLLLESDSFDCLMMIEELERIPGAAPLIEQLEKFNFKSARELLSEIKSGLEAQK